ncbi:1-phosphofructokinase [Mycoplasmopsis caviae]|uniref:1-phosphofructokinase n=1 Tax=Mycoplasmopsis caviae TaxID=55603 RepID=A0A3P8KBW0_9BACT|nr:1-phosphofructokinase [Mycoplasmopsis caviae]UUD35100.1 1-phosphofructokinase [Mycoplasmopsis caviae]VDR42084.1 1-phosphofructokinase [Mycoplasmopsis caviae]
MIYTVTFSPSLDYSMNLESDFKQGNINRSVRENYIVGGKGINVSILLNNLGTKSTVLGFVGGFVGEYIKSSLSSQKINIDFYEVSENSRINVKLNGKKFESAINANGPQISQQDIDQLVYKIDKSIKNGDTLVLAGNIPKNLSRNIYEIILERIKDRQVYIIVDATKDLLLNTLKYKPFLIKPNLEELEEIFGQKLNSFDLIKSKALELKNMGAKNVLISCGKDGAYLFDENNQVHNAKSYKGKVVSTVGAGDSMVAGFIDSYLKNNDYKRALEFSIACGSATAFDTQIASKDAIINLIEGGQKWK